MTYDLGRVRAMLEDELLSRGVRTCSIVGHAGGALRALSLALQGRVRVEAMVLLGALAGFDEAVRAQYRQIAAALRRGEDLRPLCRNTWTTPEFARHHPDQLEEIVAAMDACPATVLADELRAFAEARDLRPMLGALT
jgi:pimeloyl-ACP methyl ester carboxylesterase